jgi:predicted ATP-grasp superfamily ATP-dependent carboligase
VSSLARSLVAEPVPIGRARHVLVTDAARGSAVAFIRSLGRAGLVVTAADTDPSAPGLHSRYATNSLVYPDPSAAPEAFLETVSRFAREHDVDLVVPMTDATILPIDGRRDCFPETCALSVPTSANLRAVADKFRTVEMARRVGISVPRSALVRTTEEALCAAEEIGWPLVIKPRVSSQRDSTGRIEHFEVEFAGDWDELARAMGRLEGRVDVILQEYCPGEGHGVELLLNQGQPILAFQHRRLREIPIHGGASAYRESVPLDPDLYDQSLRLLEPLAWTGLVMVEFKLGPDGPRLMEVNGRPWGSLPLAVKSGADFPRRLVELLLVDDEGAHASVDDTYEVGVRSRNLEFDLMWIGSVLLGRRPYPYLETPRRRDAFRAMADLLRPKARFDILSRQDPTPGLRELAAILRKFSVKLREAS